MEIEKELRADEARSQEIKNENIETVHYYDNTPDAICQALTAGFVGDVEFWIHEFIRDIYDAMSEDWQHGFDVGEKLAELRAIVKYTKEGRL